jgi:hypothetical protein|nr:MAG TPA: hypothetical protein [Bacteriophage sp.]
MFNKFFKKDTSKEIGETIEAKLAELNTVLASAEIGSDEYNSALVEIDILTKSLSDVRVRKMQGKNKLEPQVKAAIITTVGGALASIAGILIIRDYEAEDGIFTSSAKSLIKKPY